MFQATALGTSMDQGLEQVVAAQSRIQSLRGRFTQTKTLSLFDETVVTSGTIVIDKPDFYCWIYDEPERRMFYLDGAHTGTLEPGTGVGSEVELDSAGLLSVVHSLTSIVSGNLDEAALQDYEIMSEPTTDQALRYTFLPRSEESRSLFAQVTIDFDQRSGLARSLEVVENNGDRSVMAFADWRSNVAVDRTQLLESFR